MEFRDTRHLVDQALRTAQLQAGVKAAATALCFTQGYAADPAINALLAEAYALLSRAEDALVREHCALRDAAWKASNA